MPPGAQRRPDPRNPQEGRPDQPSPAMVAAMAGAVDLAAVKARNDAAARAAEAPPPGAGEYVVEVTEATFQSAVIDRSFQVPVLLDLWSARSPGSVELSAQLQTLANEAAGRWVLARVEADGNLELLQALQVQGVPTVFAVIGGQLVPGFQGALPEAQLREFVAAVEQAAGEAGLSGAGAVDDADAPAPPEDLRFSAAEEALTEGNYPLAAQRYQAILDEEPANTLASAALGQVRLLERAESVDPAVVVAADAASTDVPLGLQAADAQFVSGEIDAALARLLGLLRAVAGAERDPIRERLVEYFDLLGPEDPRVAPARRELARALF